MSRSHAQYPTERAYTERAYEAGVVRRMIGSRGFLWVLGAVGMVFLTLLALGAEAWVQKQAALAPEIVAAKADVDTLKVAVNVLKNQSDAHTSLLSQSAIEQARAAALQERIFTAIKGVSDGVHALDVKIATVDQKVDDLKDQRK